MTKNELLALDNADVNFSDKLGEMFVDEMATDYISSSEIGESIVRELRRCQTEEEFEVANSMLVAICGWGLDTLTAKIEERDSTGYCWESFEPER